MIENLEVQIALHCGWCTPFYVRSCRCRPLGDESHCLCGMKYQPVKSEEAFMKQERCSNHYMIKMAVEAFGVYAG